MTDSQIIDYIKTNENLYNILKVIAILKNTPSTSLSSIKKVKKYLKTVFFNNDFTIPDSRIEKFTHGKIEVYGFQFGEDTSDLVILSKYLEEFSEKIFNQSKILISNCVFSWDSAACILVGFHDFEDEESHFFDQHILDVDELENYVQNVLHVDIWK